MMRILSFLTPLLALLLAAQAPGCIRQYNDFVGAQDVTSDYTDTVDVDVPEPKDTTDTVHTDTVDVDVCVPNCDGKVCGEDGCGGSCGTCNGPQDECVDGLCVCQSDCDGKVCGEDGCGGSCGTCPQEAVCESGECKTVAWTDTTSGLTWQVMPTGETMDWEDAKSHCSNPGLAGGGWHLPDIGELRSLIRGCPTTESGGSCNVEEGDCLAWSCQDSSCSGCSNNDGPAGGCYWPDEMEGSCSWYWSSSPVEDVGYRAWSVYFGGGGVYGSGVNYDKRARCVR